MMGWAEWFVTVMLLSILAWLAFRAGLAKGRMEMSSMYSMSPQSPDLRAAEAIWGVTQQQSQLMLGLHDLPSRMDRLEKTLKQTQESMQDVRQSTNSMLAAFVRAGLIKTVSRDEMVGETIDPPKAESGWGVDVPPPNRPPTPVKKASGGASDPLT